MLRIALWVSFLSLHLAVTAGAADPLPSWNEGATKDAILDFVDCATKDGCRRYILPAERVAVFDNDGTLWSEQPVYFQLLFAIDRVKQLASQHPEWKDGQPFKAAIEGDQKSLAESGLAGILKLVHHTDATPEWNYDRDSHVGRLDKALDEAKQRGWSVVDMENDWKSIYSFERD